MDRINYELYALALESVIFYFNVSLILFISFIPSISYSLETNWYIDSDKDRIVILDKTIQNELNTLPEVHPSTVYDDQDKIKNFSKNFKMNYSITENQYSLYQVAEGETLEQISLKLFKTKDRWSELLELNEDLIFQKGLVKGLLLKYKN